MFCFYFYRNGWNTESTFVKTLVSSCSLLVSCRPKDSELFVRAATGTVTGFWILFLHTVQIQAGGEHRFIQQRFVWDPVGGAADPDMSQTVGKEKSCLTTIINKCDLNGLCRPPLKVLKLRTTLFNVTTMNSSMTPHRGPNSQRRSVLLPVQASKLQVRAA